MPNLKNLDAELSPQLLCSTKLFSANKDVDGFNETELSQLTSVSYIYNAVDDGSSVQVLLLKECIELMHFHR